MTLAHILGFPRIGKQREIKKALEAYWDKQLDLASLLAIGRQICRENWQLQHTTLDFVTVGDFSWYDHVLDTAAMLGVVPARFATKQISLDVLFQMARGNLTENVIACEMTKWFDTNYHYIVPEIEDSKQFRLSYYELFEAISQAQALGYSVKPVILGPLSFLWLSKCHPIKFDKLSLLDNLMQVYQQIFKQLKALNISWVQVDEPILGLDLPLAWLDGFKKAYGTHHGLNILLTTYFTLFDKIALLNDLAVQGIHLDLTKNCHQLEQLTRDLPNQMILSAGVVDGRNVWKCDLSSCYGQLLKTKEKIQDRLWVASTCSLLHVPVDLTLETTMDPKVKSWLSFAVQKIEEVSALARALNDETPHPLFQISDQCLKMREQSSLIHDPKVKARIAHIEKDMYHRKHPYPKRTKTQKEILNLPLFPTTTIGSFPQTQDLRKLRFEYKKGVILKDEYQAAIAKQIENNIAIQEALDLDVLVHGEAERNDMVEYFAKLLQGYVLSDNGWVQSYGSRLVKPPILFGDVARSSPMTISWINYAQSKTTRPVKGMLTGPITMMRWSFIRDDQDWTITVTQLALALRDEIEDLEKSGIKIIQLDEPAFREGLPLTQKDWPFYLNWAVNAFRLASCVVQDSTQIHTHMCYSEFNDIIESIAQLDADVITIETARSQRELFLALEQFDYPNEIGPGIYDVHSPRVPTIKEMVDHLTNAVKVIPSQRLWVNPDCGLKTRDWAQTKAALSNMVAAAKIMRRSTPS
ncbi:MAG: 5-methyltetrahydropteroyltriglutamate--homocysteine S-methyltransferase [Proteobacteria bacterium]|nr:5-methyltetrahydropteroyltriglutamate--homocysteine S-methyltransferase [Pseudomonadota bacterium]